MRRVITHQLPKNFLPGFQQGFIPFAVPLTGFRFEEGILDSSADGILGMLRNEAFKSGMMLPDIPWIVWHRGPCMAVPDETPLDPISADMVFLERVEDQLSVFNRFANIEHFLFARIVDFENDMRVVEGHSEGDASTFHKIGHFLDTPEILGPHVDMYLESRAAPNFFSGFIGFKVDFRDLFVAHQRTVRVVHDNLGVMD